MPIDPNIILQQVLPDPNAPANNLRATVNFLQAAQQMRYNQQKMQQMNALRGIYGNPSNFDQSGNLTPQALVAAGGIDPEAAMQARRDAIQQKHFQALDLMQSTELGKIKLEALAKHQSEIIRLDDNLREQGVPDDARNKQVQEAWSDGLSRLHTTGVVDDATLRSIGPYDRQRVAASQEAYDSWMADRKQKLQEEAEDRRWASEERSADYQKRGLDLREREFAADQKSAEEKKTAPKSEGPLSHDAAEALADAYMASGDPRTLSNLKEGSKAQVWDIIADKLRAKGLTGSDLAEKRAKFQADTAELKTLGQREANAVTSGLKAFDTADKALEQSYNVSRGKFVPLNKLMQMKDEAISDPELKAFKAYNFGFLQEYVNVVAPTGVPPESLREHAMQLLSTADSPEAYARGMQVLQREIRIAIESPQKAREMIEARMRGENKPMRLGHAEILQEFKRQMPNAKEVTINEDGSISARVDGKMMKFDMLEGK